MSDILPYRADYYPVIGQIMGEMDVAGTINRVVEADDSQVKIDVGTFVCLMILNLLGDVNIRLYTMDSFFEDKALPLLLPWKPDVDLDEINDDRAARVLDALWAADPQKIFSAVSHKAIQVHELDTNVIHGDTTSRSFQGVYANTAKDASAPFVTFGHNKDHRPDLKQLVFGVGTTADGIPIIAEVTDGNESDKTLNGRWVQDLRYVLGKDVSEFLLYVADSALVTTSNLHLMDTYHIDFISRLPGTFSIEEELKRNAFSDDNWISIGKLLEEKKAAMYHLCEMTGDIDGIRYRFVVVKSDQKDKRKLKTLDRAVEREYKTVAKDLLELRKRPFACKRDAEIEKERFLKEHMVKYHITDWEIEERTEKVKRKGRGRPRNDEKTLSEMNHYLSGKVQCNDQMYMMDRELCGLFVLITSLEDVKKHSSRYILERYKGQGTVERIFKFIMNPSWVGSFCLKKPERIAALGYLLLIAALIYTLWERRVRKALSDPNVAPIDGLNQQKTRTPTTFALQKVMSSILILSQIVDGEVSIWLPKPLKNNQKRILELSGFSEKIYTMVP